MLQIDVIGGLVGGTLIGISAAAFLLLAGRIAGVSGIMSGLFRPTSFQFSWQFAFLIGIALGSLLVAILFPGTLSPVTFANGTAMSVFAGLLVGFGARFGGGCTSGHGVCGVSRLAPRSIAATATFFASALITVYIVRHILGGAGT